MTPHTKYQGAYPTSRLQDGDHGGFAVNVTTHLWVPSGGATGSLAVTGSWASAGPAAAAGTASSKVATTLPAGESSISVQLMATAKQIKLWWPNGVGEHHLYNVSAAWTPSSAATVDSNPVVAVTSRRLGFRVFALVTVNDTNATVVANKASNASTGQVNDTGTHGMFFRVNGAPLYSRGANMIPMEELEG